MSTDKTGAPDSLKRWSLMVKWKFDQEWQLSGDTLFSQHFTFEKYPKSFIGHESYSDKSDPFSSYILDQIALYERMAVFCGY